MASEISPNHFTAEEQNGMINGIVYLIEEDKNSEVLTSAIEAMTNLIPHSKTIHESFVIKFYYFIFTNINNSAYE